MTSTSETRTPAPLPPGSPLSVAPVVPVVVIDDVTHAVPLARALVAGGLPIIEVTLRTPVALEAVRAIAEEVPGILLGAGTVCTPAQAEAAAAAGSQFLVSPGATPGLLDAMDAIADEAERVSAVTCERRGQSGTLHRTLHG